MNIDIDIYVYTCVYIYFDLYIQWGLFTYASSRTMGDNPTETMDAGSTDMQGPQAGSSHDWKTHGCTLVDQGNRTPNNGLLYQPQYLKPLPEMAWEPL